MTQPTETEILEAVHKARELHGKYISAADNLYDAEKAYMDAQARVIEMIRVAEPKSHALLGLGQVRAGDAAKSYSGPVATGGRIGPKA